MINLKTEEFVLDGPPLQSLQQLIQWVGDFVLYLMANLPNQVRGWLCSVGVFTGYVCHGQNLGYWIVFLRAMLHVLGA